MFKLAKENKVWWPVALPQRGPEGLETVEVRVLYRIYTRAELLALDQQLREALSLGLGDALTGKDLAEKQALLRKRLEQDLLRRRYARCWPTRRCLWRCTRG